MKRSVFLSKAYDFFVRYFMQRIERAHQECESKTQEHIKTTLRWGAPDLETLRAKLQAEKELARLKAVFTTPQLMNTSFVERRNAFKDVIQYAVRECRMGKPLGKTHIGSKADDDELGLYLQYYSKGRSFETNIDPKLEFFNRVIVVHARPEGERPWAPSKAKPKQPTQLCKKLKNKSK